MASVSDIQAMLNKLSLDLGQDIKNEIKKATDKLENKLDTKLSELENKNKITDKKLENLLEKNKALEEKTKEFERNKRKQNIIIYGLISRPCSFQEQLSAVLSFFNSQLQIPTKKEEINFITRIGPKDSPNIAILVGLTSLIKKIEILRSGNKLRGSKISITEDFPKEVALKRKELLPKLKQLRQENKHAILSYDKLIVDGKIYESNPTFGKNDKKRDIANLETDSPEKSQSQESIQHKLKRVNSISKPRGRPPSKSRSTSNSQPNSRSASPQILTQPSIINTTTSTQATQGASSQI